MLPGVCLAAGMNLGSAKELKGKIYVLSIFITDRDWPQDEKEEILRKQHEAEEWLKESAAAYGSDVTFEHGNYGYQTPLYYTPLPTGYSTTEKVPVDVVYEVMRKIGWNEPKKFTDWVLENTGCEQTAVIIYCNLYGRGYSMPYDKNYSDKYYLEGSLLFKGYNENLALYPSSIAHEMLHQFGAIDLYEVKESDKKKAEMATEDYPDDVMRQITYHISDVKLGPLTAWRVGIGPYDSSFEKYLQ